MNFKTYRLIPLILILYLFPIFSLTLYTLSFVPSEMIFEIFALGLSATFFGSLILYMVLRNREVNDFPHEENVQSSLDLTAINQSLELKSSPDEWKDKYEKVLNEKEEWIEQFNLSQQEGKSLQIQLEEMHRQEEENSRLFLEKLSQKDQLLLEKQKILQEQRALIERHQQHVVILESKERDLQYEIKTLLELGSLDADEIHNLPPLDEVVPVELLEQKKEASILTPSFFQVKTSEEASIQLKKCLDIAAKMTRSYVNPSTTSSKNTFSDGNVLDLRRLQDNFQVENASAVFLLSQKDQRPIFVNNQIKDILGWPKDNFVQNFQDIISESYDDWKSSLIQLSTKSEVCLKLKSKTKMGEKVSVNCHLGLVPSGIFRNYVVAVAYKTDKADENLPNK